MAEFIIAELMARDFDITAVKELVGEQFEGHAYSFVPGGVAPAGFWIAAAPAPTQQAMARATGRTLTRVTVIVRT